MFLEYSRTTIQYNECIFNNNDYFTIKELLKFKQTNVCVMIGIGTENKKKYCFDSNITQFLQKCLSVENNIVFKKHIIIIETQKMTKVQLLIV